MTSSPSGVGTCTDTRPRRRRNSESHGSPWWNTTSPGRNSLGRPARISASRVAAESVSNDSPFTIPCNHWPASRTRVRSHISGNDGIEIDGIDSIGGTEMDGIDGNVGNEIDGIDSIEIDGIRVDGIGVDGVAVDGADGNEIVGMDGIDIDGIDSIIGIDIDGIDSMDIGGIASIDGIDIDGIDAIDGIDRYGAYGSAGPSSGPV